LNLNLVNHYLTHCQCNLFRIWSESLSRLGWPSDGLWCVWILWHPQLSCYHCSWTCLAATFWWPQRCDCDVDAREISCLWRSLCRIGTLFSFSLFGTFSTLKFIVYKVWDACPRDETLWHWNPDRHECCWRAELWFQSRWHYDSERSHQPAWIHWTSSIEGT